jgi:hypothetical protein
MKGPAPRSPGSAPTPNPGDEAPPGTPGKIVEGIGGA